MEADAGSLALEMMEEAGLDEVLLPAKKNMMDIPKELFDHIFAHLELNDLLRLRRVSKEMKNSAEGYLRLHVNSSKFFRVNLSDDEDEALSTLLAFDFVAPFSKFDIGDLMMNMVPVWDNGLIQEFAEKYGSRVTHLKIDSIDIPIVSRKSIRFFESFQNLEHLEIGYMTGHKRNKNIQAAGASNSKELIPSSFKRLRVLIVEEYDCEMSLEDAGKVWKFVEECTSQVQHLAHPHIIGGSIMDLGDLPGGRFGCVRRILEGPQQSHLKYYDLLHFWDVDDTFQSSVQDFYGLVTACAERDVKLLNVDARLIERMMKLETRDKKEHGRKLSSVVVSLLRLHKSSFLLELPHLEDIYLFHGTSECSMPRPYSFQRKAWSSLNHLDILIDSDHVNDIDEDGVSSISVNIFLEYFFLGVTRAKMESLRLNFDVKSSPSPRMIDVLRSCPNLKELSLTCWPGSNQEISILWTSLPRLEKVTFENCSDLGIEAFVGTDQGNAAFLEANNLRNLTLSGLEKMPKISDRLFTQVLRHKPLKELHLESEERISNGQITVAGLTSLLLGALSRTIERLSLDIQLEGITAEELKELGRMFRSWKML